jgi:uncharacterized membrane protein required for colicin V production
VDAGERLSGAALGLAKGLVVSAVLLYLLVGAFPDARPAVSQARVAGLVLPLTPIVDRIVHGLEVLLPDELTDKVQAGYEAFRSAGRDLSGAVGTRRDATAAEGR